MALLAQLGDARTRFYGLNAIACALLKEHHGGRAFVQISTFAETQGWMLDMMPQKSLGNIRMIAVDDNGHAQIADDRQMSPTDVPCCAEGCGAPATFAEGLDAERQSDQPAMLCASTGERAGASGSTDRGRECGRGTSAGVQRVRAQSARSQSGLLALQRVVRRAFELPLA